MILAILPDWVHDDGNTYWVVAATVFLIYIILITYVRIFGLRTFAKMTSFDFATTIAVGSTIATVCTNSKVSLGTGAVALFCIISVQAIFSFLQSRFSFFKIIAKNTPYLLMENGRVLHKNLKKCNVEEKELMAKLREKGVSRLEEVQAVVFESTGNFSVMCGDHLPDNRILNGIAR